MIKNTKPKTKGLVRLIIKIKLNINLQKNRKNRKKWHKSPPLDN